MQFRQPTQQLLRSQIGEEGVFHQLGKLAARIDLGQLSAKGSLYVTRPTLFHYMMDDRELHERAADVLGWIAAGELRLRVEEEYPLAGAADAHRALEGRKTTGKVLLVP